MTQIIKNWKNSDNIKWIKRTKKMLLCCRHNDNIQNMHVKRNENVLNSNGIFKFSLKLRRKKSCKTKLNDRR